MRPSKGTITGRVWDIADALSGEAGTVALRREVVSTAVAEGINPATANTQFGHWKRATYPNDPLSRSTATKRRVPGTAEISSHQQEAEAEPDRDWAWLLKNGFTYSTDWELNDLGVPVLDRTAPKLPGIYVFVLRDEIVYVGVTRRTLSKRMDDYRRGHRQQRTSARVRELIVEALGRGDPVRVLFATPKPVVWNGFTVDTALGLEPELISKLRPRWNLQGLSK